jgi:hypothetical protein
VAIWALELESSEQGEEGRKRESAGVAVTKDNNLRPHGYVEKEIFIGGQTVRLTLSGSECGSSAGMGFIGGATPQARESVPPREPQGHWPLFICDCQIEWVDMHS